MPKQDHDQRMKLILMEMPAEFVALTQSPFMELLDLSAPPKWETQEVFLDPPQGEKALIDLVARIPLKEKTAEGFTEALLHFEVEARDLLTNLHQRMPQYIHTLRVRSKLPVLSFGLYLAVMLEGIGWDKAQWTFAGFELGTLFWRYLGLPKLDAMKYVAGDNLLGVGLSVLMQVAEDDNLCSRRLR